MLSVRAMRTVGVMLSMLFFFLLSVGVLRSNMGSYDLSYGKPLLRSTELPCLSFGLSFFLLRMFLICRSFSRGYGELKTILYASQKAVALDGNKKTMFVRRSTSCLRFDKHEVAPWNVLRWWRTGKSRGENPLMFCDQRFLGVLPTVRRSR